MLKYSNISTSAIAYSLDSSNIYSHSAIEDIKNKQIGFLNPNYLYSDLSKIILHSEKLGFDIHDSSKRFIRMKCDYSFNEEIIDFLNYKNQGDKIDLVLTELEKIKFNHK